MNRNIKEQVVKIFVCEIILCNPLKLNTLPKKVLNGNSLNQLHLSFNDLSTIFNSK